MNIQLPQEVRDTLQTIELNGYEAYVVGGCVRDLLLGKTPHDWDITTNAHPSVLQELFQDTVYENDFGTVRVLTGSDISSLKSIEVTTYRTETSYSDSRHPDAVVFSETLEEDLQRRDFTINAMALSMKKEVLDPLHGQQDLEKKIIRTVGNPTDRFSEDALRLMRAVRFAAQLGFEIESDTRAAISDQSATLANIAIERVQEEFTKLIVSDRPMFGIIQLHELGLLQYIVPELTEGIGVTQSGHHIYPVWEHNLQAMQYAADQEWSLEVRLAALFHDIGKPRTKEGEGEEASFHNHEIVGASMTHDILTRLRYSKDIIRTVRKLVRYHMFYYDIGEVSESSVRRLISNVGLDMVDDLIKVRMCDRIGSGVPKAEPYRLRHFQFMIDKVSRDPISVKMLAVDGNTLMEHLELAPGPVVGYLLHILLEDVLENPDNNTAEYLLERAESLIDLSDDELQRMAEQGEKKRLYYEEQEIDKLKDKHHVR